jgi:hypothetical protein
MSLLSLVRYMEIASFSHALMPRLFSVAAFPASPCLFPAVFQDVQQQQHHPAFY